MLFILLSLITLFPIAVLIIGRLVSAPRYMGAVSDHFDGKNFFNIWGKNPSGFGDAFKWMSDKERVKKPWSEVQGFTLGEKPIESVSDGNLRATCIGHSTVLIQMDGVNILTDPVWYARASPFQFMGPKRVRPAGIKMEDLPPIHLILQSHNHWDHLDIINLPKIYAQHKPLIITSLGVSQFLKQKGMENSIDMDWWDEYSFKTEAIEFKITCLPTQHFSGRGLFDRNGTLWSGFMISSPISGNVYFAGDSGYAPFFKTIGEKFGKIRLALIPIGAYLPAWFMSPIHCTPSEAVDIHVDVKAENSLAIHHNTFPLSDEGQYQPIEDLNTALSEKQISRDTFFVLEEGKWRDIV